MITINKEKYSIYLKEQCKTKAQILLNESDWADLPSNRSLLQNIDEWDQYRIEIKKLRVNPVEQPNFPNKPSVIWKNFEGVSNE